MCHSKTLGTTKKVKWDIKGVPQQVVKPWKDDG